MMMMTMTKKIILFFAFGAATTESFVVLPRKVATGAGRSSSSVVAVRETVRTQPAGSSNDEVLARLEKEFRDLQNELLQDLVVKKDKVAASDVAEAMLEKAIDTVAVQKYKQQEVLDEEHEREVHARNDILQARAIEYEAHSDAMSAEHEVKLLESIDAAYEDLERVRDLSVAHAAHRLEQDAKDIEIDSTFQELEAESEEERAAEMIKQLDRNLAQLKASLEELRKTKNEQTRTQWKAEELTDFLQHQPTEE